MTLIIANASAQHQIIVADRKLTANRVPTGAPAYKFFQFVNFTQNYIFVVAFSGLARYGTFHTLDWLMDAMQQIFNPKMTITNGIHAFRAESTRRFKLLKQLPPKDKGLTIILCGRYNWFGPNRAKTRYIPFSSIISNSVDTAGRQLASISPDFCESSLTLYKTKGHITQCIGDLQAAGQFYKEFVRLARLFRKPISYETKVYLCRDYIRIVSRNSKTVGEDILAIALLNNGNAEAFDFPQDDLKVARTIPPMISAEGSRLTGFQLTPSEAPQPSPNRPKTAILTDWTGQGTFGNTHRALIIDEYHVTSTDLTGADTWPFGQDCPYYGLVVGIDANTQVIEQIRSDKRFLVVFSEDDTLESPPSSEWLAELRQWLFSRHMPSQQLDILLARLSQMTLNETMQELCTVMKVPKGFYP